ncbi:MAG: HIT domain-containing protein [Arenicellales bacterium]
MQEDTLFSKIVKGELSADIVFQDERVTSFRDIQPQAPTHILIVPNKIIPTVNDVTEEDEATLGHMFLVARDLAESEGVNADGYRLLVNCGRHANQEVFHLHMHLLGGRPLGRMLQAES